jgi:DNA-directed RNA polymerase subunit RPC12/RpoP
VTSSRPDSDGWVYEYWADEGGEHKGKRLRPWRMSMWSCPKCSDEVSEHGSPPTVVCPGCGTNMVFQRHVIIKGEEGISQLSERSLTEKKHLQSIINDMSFAMMNLMNFNPEAVSLGGTLTLQDRTDLNRCWGDMVRVHKRLMRIRARQGWDG